MHVCLLAAGLKGKVLNSLCLLLGEDSKKLLYPIPSKKISLPH